MTDDPPPTVSDAGRTRFDLDRVRRSVALVRMLAPRELRIRYRQSVLDIAWALIAPIVILVVYGLVLTRSFDVDGGCSPYLASAWAGLVVWTFFSTALGGAVTSLISSSQLMTKLYFPREALPLSVVTAASVELVIGVVTLLVLMLVLGVSFHLTAFLAVVPLVMILVWSAALSVMISVVAVFVRDLVHAVHLLLRVGFFATPVMYEARFLPGALRWTEQVNPVAVAITGVRDTLLCGAVPSPGLLSVHLLIAVGALVGAVRYTAAVEARAVDLV